MLLICRGVGSELDWGKRMEEREIRSTPQCSGPRVSDMFFLRREQRARACPLPQPLPSAPPPSLCPTPHACCRLLQLPSNVIAALTARPTATPVPTPPQPHPSLAGKVTAALTARGTYHTATAAIFSSPRLSAIPSHSGPLPNALSPGSVIAALAARAERAHVPYHDSKLTLIHLGSYC